MILLDYSSIAHSALHINIKEIEQNIDLVRHTIFNIIRQYNVEHRDQFGEMILCMDHTSNWRREAFPQYKASRRKARKESDVDWQMVYTELNKVRDELMENGPYRCIRIEGCEADDVIGAICEAHSNPSPILIISPDKDFVQLQKYPNVKQYSNLQKKWVEPEVSAEYDLLVKVLKGDTGDGVPNVLSDDETFINEERQTPLTRKKIEALMANPEALGTTIARRIVRNRTLIDLTRTPEDIKEETDAAFTNRPNGSITKMMTLLAKHQMKMMMESLSDFEPRFLEYN